MPVSPLETQSKRLQASNLETTRIMESGARRRMGGDWLGISQIVQMERIYH